MSSKNAKLPIGSGEKITIICTEEQERYIRKLGCIACDDDVCDAVFCDKCAYDADNIEFKTRHRMDLSKYKTEENKITAIKNQYLDSSLSMKDMLNGTYSDLPVEDKINLLCWSDDDEKFKVLENGEVVNRYTVSELRKYVKKYAKEDGCVHYILEEADGAITQTCDAWVNDVYIYARKNGAKILETIYP